MCRLLLSNVRPKQRPAPRSERDSSVELLTEDNLRMFDEGATMPSAAEVIRLLDLKPHPEGGHFRETFRDLLSARARRALALAQGRCGRSLALPRRGTAQARDRGGREGIARVRDAGSGSYRRRAPTGDRAGACLAGGAKPGRVDAGELHGR